jgi:hypothetical protein
MTAPSTYKKYFTFTVFVITLVAGAWLGYSFSDEKEESQDIGYQRYFNDHYKIFTLNLPSQLEFGGEPVPLEKVDVRERFDRELLVNTYWQSQSLLFHKRANRWFPIIEPILKENGVPDDFKYLALIESGLTNVVSPAGATGFWQILKDTGRELGLEINNEVDERYHVEKSTEAACKYLKSAYNTYGSWTMAAASYNMGIHGLKKQMGRQNAGDYYDLLLNEETSRYVFRILAAKEIISKPAQYGFHFRPTDLYEPYKTESVILEDAVPDFSIYAMEQGINYKILKILNPWLRDSYLTNPAKKSYEIKIPADHAFGEVIIEQNDATNAFTSDTLK